MIQVRLKPGLTRRAARGARSRSSARAVAMPQWQLTTRRGYTVTGAPVRRRGPRRRARRLDAAAAASSALVVMALVLALVFRSRLRLLPLAVALGAVAVTFGADGAASARR